MKVKCTIKIIAFVLIFALIFGVVSKIVTVPQDYRNYQWVEGFYEEPKKSLDAVYVGSSNCYAFWNSMIAWNEYGINVWPYATNGMMFEAAEYIIKEARKTQPDALYIVNINTLCDPDKNMNRIHWNVDYMPFSLNKMALINRLSEASGYSFSESMEFYIPMIRYHDRWSQLQKEDFTYEVDGMKGAAHYNPYLRKSEDVTEQYIVSDEEYTLTDEMQETINSLLDYCDTEDVNVLFVTVPRAEDDENATKIFKATNTLLESRGYPTLYLTESLDEMNLDLTTDYYNYRHTNIHGSIKFTRYLAEYLVENYQLEDKRGDELYGSWDAGWEKYHKVLEPWILDIELDEEHRDYAIQAPDNLQVEGNKDGNMLSWEASDGADFYMIYRKKGTDGVWKAVGESAETIYIDGNLEEAKKVSYRVVPCYEKNGETYYGSFDYNGISINVK